MSIHHFREQTEAEETEYKEDIKIQTNHKEEDKVKKNNTLVFNR